MKKLMIVLLAATIVCLSACNKKNNDATMNNIDQTCVKKTVKALCEKYAGMEGIEDRIARGVEQAAAFWTEADGTPAEFEDFCMENFVADPDERARMAAQLEQNFESLWGCFNKMNVDLNLPIHVDGPEPTQLDELFGAYSPSAHFIDDMFEQKIAFIVVLNFPFYTLEEKNTLGTDWSRQQWAYARLGDVFTARVPAECQQALSAQLSAADNYISNYNIQMGHLLDDQGVHIFPDMSLITHWGLRDELKTHYNEGEQGLAKQRMIYQVMRRIIDQSIPECVINNPEYDWNPYANTVTKDGKQVNVKPEPDTRYQYFLDNFHAMQQLDRFNPRYPTAIARAFEEDMEVSFDEIEQLFDTYCSSPQVGEVAKLIEQRLGRKLEPFDIWYDGFKSRSSLNEDDLSAQTRRLYPNREAFATKGMPSILNQLGFSKEKNDFICSHITVDPSRGAGHAWESNMRTDNARLRTRIGKDGMDYKGYNIAVHEFGHNVEQTITLHNVDHYIMKGVPNTAFTEALAFAFQIRDLDFLGYQNNDPTSEALQTLDIFWGCYEIMGVALVDMYCWRWLYEHPGATVAQLKEQVIRTAQEVWNKYYAQYLGEQDSPILAIYSHMIDSPLYLPNYPYGHIIHFQLEQQLKGKSVAAEIERIYPAGRLTPQLWMRHAVGNEVSTQPLLDAASEALKAMKK
ncbi:MAG: hypothetical protein IKW93_06180 [Bacteroidales bacterium]|nr:hypothetical protein [Bacteroidales bacterium]